MHFQWSNNQHNFSSQKTCLGETQWLRNISNFHHTVDSPITQNLDYGSWFQGHSHLEISGEIVHKFFNTCDIQIEVRTLETVREWLNANQQPRTLDGDINIYPQHPRDGISVSPTRWHPRVVWQKHGLAVSVCISDLTQIQFNTIIQFNNTTIYKYLQQFKSCDWIGLCMVLHLHQHSIGYMGDGFYRSKDPTNSIKVMKELREPLLTANSFRQLHKTR